MGAMRLLLALSVVYGHAGLISAIGFPLVPGDTAVEVFYGISGFYMALVLNEYYRPENSTYRLFIGNRFARLFPAYGVILLATLVLAAVVAAQRQEQLPFIDSWRTLPQLPPYVTTFILGSQVVFVGLDLTQFMSFHNGSLSLVSDFYDPHALAGVLAVPPAWTLGLEFAFYLIAPLIVRRSVKAIVILFFCSIAFRLFLQFDFELYNDPWSYRFFPSELALFLVGVLGYRVYRSLENGRDMRLLALFTGVCFCVAGAVLVNRWHGWSRVASTGLLLLLLLAIPFLFRICKTNRLDRFVGELSYPIYICHFLVIWTLTYLWGMSAGMFRGFVILMTTVLLSIVIYLAIDRPIDGWRHKQFAPRVRQTISAPAASAALS